MEVYSTTAAPRGQRTAYWNRIYTSRFAPAHVAPSDAAGFHAELTVGHVGAIDFACMRSRPATVVRPKDEARRASDRLLGFILVTRGSGRALHCGHEIALEPGDVVMSDNTEAMTCSFSTPVESITARAPEAFIRARLPNFDSLRGMRLPGKVGLTETSVAMARCLSNKLGDALPAWGAARAGGQFLDILAASYAIAYEQPAELSSVSGVRRARVHAFIEANLNDPELTPGRIAAALRISPRYLRKLMGEAGETASSFILRRRLEECARQLEFDAGGARSITNLAFAWGFNSTAHFARVFKAKYGLSPRDYREASREMILAR